MARSIEYWRFYWPLAVSSTSLLLASQLQNGVLARFPSAERELANFAVAGSLNFLFTSALIFLPQQTNAFGRTPAGRQLCFRFCLTVGVVLSLPLFATAFTTAGGGLLADLFKLNPERLESVQSYLRYYAPLVVLTALRGYFGGLLIQARRTGVLTALNTASLSCGAVVLITGLKMGWPAVETVCLSQATTGMIDLALGWQAYKRWYVPIAAAAPDPVGEPPVTWRASWDFFWPVAVTSLMFAFSRPVIFSFVSRLPNPESVLASLRLGFDLAMLFINPLNQFRHLYVTFGNDDPGGVRRFLIQVAVVATILMAVCTVTPLGMVIFGKLLGAREPVLTMARWAFGALCFIPAAMSVRNHYHGRCLATRDTRWMGVGGVVRVAGIYLASFLLLNAGWLNHFSAGLILSFGFFIEGMTVMAGTSRRAGPDSPSSPRQ